MGGESLAGWVATSESRPASKISSTDWVISFPTPSPGMRVTCRGRSRVRASFTVGEVGEGDVPSRRRRTLSAGAGRASGCRRQGWSRDASGPVRRRMRVRACVGECARERASGVSERARWRATVRARGETHDGLGGGPEDAGLGEHACDCPAWLCACVERGRSAVPKSEARRGREGER